VEDKFIVIRGIKKVKELTGKRSTWDALGAVWRAGISAYQDNSTVNGLRATIKELEKDHLEMSRLVHEYETKLINLERQVFELAKQNKEFKWSFAAMRRENEWMKEELLARKKKE
jgi:hypothetical protein